MIYTKEIGEPGVRNNVWERSESTQKSVPDVMNKTITVPSMTEYDFSQVQPFVPVKVRRRRVRREARRIKAAGKTPLWLAFITAFVICTFCSCILYLCCAGIYLPENVVEIYNHAFSWIYSTEKADEAPVNGVFPSKPSVNEPVYLTQKPSEIISAATNGESIDAQEEPLPDLSDSTQSASGVSGGKSGGDGKVFLPLTQLDMSDKDVKKLSNQTSQKPDAAALMTQKPAALEGLTITDEPLVLILHTHATECYSQSAGDSYDSAEPTRSEDTECNVVCVGKELCDELCDFGVPCIRSDKLHDKVSFIKAYTNSKNTAKWYLEKYPSLRIIIDLHRDAIIRSDGEKVKPTVSIAGENYAQLMFVVGTNESGTKHPNWQNNLCLALNIQEAAQESYPGLFRPINLRTASFNQQLSDGYLLLEVGSCGNNLDEALRSARAFASVLARFLSQKSQQRTCISQ